MNGEENWPLQDLVRQVREDYNQREGFTDAMAQLAYQEQGVSEVVEFFKKDRVLDLPYVHDGDNAIVLLPVNTADGKVQKELGDRVYSFFKGQGIPVERTSLGGSTAYRIPQHRVGIDEDATVSVSGLEFALRLNYSEKLSTAYNASLIGRNKASKAKD